MKISRKMTWNMQRPKSEKDCRLKRVCTEKTKVCSAEQVLESAWQTLLQVLGILTSTLLNTPLMGGETARINHLMEKYQPLLYEFEFYERQLTFKTYPWLSTLIIKCCKLSTDKRDVFNIKSLCWKCSRYFYHTNDF